MGWGPRRLFRLAGVGLDRQAHTCRDIACAWLLASVCTIALADPERIGNVLKEGPAGTVVSLEVRRGCWETGWRQGGGAKGLPALLGRNSVFFSLQQDDSRRQCVPAR
jgi:hypothetical protein